MKTNRIIIPIAALALVVSGCSSNSGGGDSGSTDGAPFVVAQNQEPTTLDPHAREDGGERIVNGNIYETLLEMDGEGELSPLLASDQPELIDDLTWQIKLREGVTFHDGSTFEAEDVKASFERVLDPDFGSEQSAHFGIESIEAVDDTTVEFVTVEPDPVLPKRLYWVKIMPSEYVDSSEVGSHPIGTGPYEFVTWNRGQSVEMSAFADYWDDAPDIQDAEFVFVPEGGSRTAGTMSGEYDLSTHLVPEDTERLPNFASVPGLEQALMVLDNSDGPTQDERVRDALNYAVDKQALAEDLYQGYAEVQECTIIGKTTVGYTESLDPYPYDPERATELLKEAGAEGADLEVIGTSGRWLKDRELTEAVAQYWQEAGINPKTEILNFDSYLERLFSEDRPDAIFLSETSELMDASQSMSSYYAMEAPGSSNSDEELQDLINRAASETDPVERQALFDEASAHACDTSLFTFLITIEDIYGLSDRVAAWDPRVDAQIFLKTISLA